MLKGWKQKVLRKNVCNTNSNSYLTPPSKVSQSQNNFAKSLHVTKCAEKTVFNVDLKLIMTYGNECCVTFAYFSVFSFLSVCKEHLVIHVRIPHIHTCTHTYSLTHTWSGEPSRNRKKKKCEKELAQKCRMINHLNSFYCGLESSHEV